MYTAPNTDTFLLEYSLQQSAGPNLQFFLEWSKDYSEAHSSKIIFFKWHAFKLQKCIRITEKSCSVFFGFSIL